jgi:hypothetical protein
LCLPKQPAARLSQTRNCTFASLVAEVIATNDGVGMMQKLFINTQLFYFSRKRVSAIAQ